MSNQRFTVTLEKKKSLTHNVLELHFSKPEGFDYTAGQFVQFFVPDGEKELSRSYSLCTTPADEHIGFCIKLLEDGKASKFFEAMRVGDSAEIEGPKGRFCNEHPTPLFFVATGAGIAPIMGILKDELINKKNTAEMRLLFGVRNEKDLFWIDKFSALAAAHPQFTYTTVLSQPEKHWPGLRGRVTAHITAHSAKHRFFLCGSGDMVKDVRKLLLDQGVDAKQIHFEIF
ncbi:MAG: hypothetical protein COU33_02285 [Candidatus Magasanikbacteria bacterium CG10_big_fil_rev_8_21_14_0_10_43_6]|uniref:FAD-binding FR-type domain-containing protein n=1 Tax=Candidatus Magasanikbacteria bacterium CG10_big_fil_rev_8_21_14_0_10_43_6 TaxID=1974650 RepID=A0A2M6W1J1_9BACT|nr:MAG: hypothetical protein COU33_02285 [Candidatus Magasanikbacteria bacterium CG10_big_fil_rev_8_21_14_0_10_43_6]